MRRHWQLECLFRIALFFIFGTGLIACQTTTSIPPASQPTVFEGVEIKLKETIDDTLVQYSTDRQDSDRSKYVDVDSKLRLNFSPPTESGLLEASPEWKQLEIAVEIFRDLQTRYLDLVKRAAAMPQFAVEGTASLQQDLRDFRDSLFSSLLGLVGSAENPGLITQDELNTIFISAGVSAEVNPYDEVVKLINAKQEALRQKIRTSLNSGGVYEVTVRGTIDPQVGKRQQIQIPEYFTIEDHTGSIESQNVKRAAQYKKFEAEYRAALDLAASVREIQENKDEIEAELKKFLDTAETQLRMTASNLELMLQTWPDDLESRIDEAQSETAARLRSNLQRLQDDVQLADQVASDIKALVDDVKSFDVTDLLQPGRAPSIFADIGNLKMNIAQLLDKVNGTRPDDGWDDLVGSILTDITQITSGELDAGTRTAMLELQSSIGTGFASTRNELSEILPITDEVLGRLDGAFNGSGQFIVAVDEMMPATGTEIPHKFGGDLPDAVVDLSRTPLTHGDDFTLSVRIWPLEGSENSRRPDAVPVETFNYSFDAINAGWVWSGDLVFTKPQDDEYGDKFEANAAVSREWRFYDRLHSTSAVNKWRPGIGFHAVQLNQDPDQSAEVGIGVNASLWNGLMRIGYGYNLNVNGSPEYWFIGFGVTSALSQISDLSGFQE